MSRCRRSILSRRNLVDVNWDCRARAPNDQRPGAAILVVEPLNQSEEPTPNLVVAYARRETLTSPPLGAS